METNCSTVCWELQLMYVKLLFYVKHLFKGNCSAYFALEIHTESGICLNSNTHRDQMELVFWLLVCLQFMCLQYLSIVVWSFAVLVCKTIILDVGNFAVMPTFWVMTNLVNLLSNVFVLQSMQQWISHSRVLHNIVQNFEYQLFLCYLSGCPLSTNFRLSLISFW